MRALLLQPTAVPGPLFQVCSARKCDALFCCHSSCFLLCSCHSVVHEYQYFV